MTNPIKNAPRTLTTIVPNGNELKNNRSVCSLIRKRNKAPMPPPKKMDNKILISSYRPNEPVIQSDHLEKIYFFLCRQGCTQLDDPDH